MRNSGLLQDKKAVVFGAGGSIGRAVAKEFAAEGAEVFLCGRTRSNIAETAKQIAAAGGHSHVSVVDVLDAVAVDQYFDGIIKQTGRVDVTFNAVGPLVTEYGQGTNAVDLSLENFMVPLETVVKSHFIVASTAARRMVKQRSGVIILLTGSPARGHVEGATAIGAAFGAVESLTENLAVELGPAGVRVVCLRTTANVDSRTIEQAMDILGRKASAPREQMIARMAGLNFLKTSATVSDTANAAVLIASDRARMLSGTVVNATGGSALD